MARRILHVKRYEGKRLDNVFMIKDANILTIENIYFPPLRKNIPKVYIYNNRNSQII